MNKLGPIFSLISCLALVACNTSTEEMRTDAREKDTIHFELPYGTVYSNFVRRATQCFHEGTPVSYYFIVAREIVPGNSGTVEMVQGGMAKSVMISADILATSNGSEITYYINHRFSMFSDFHPVIVEWANGIGTKCGMLFE